MPPLFPRCSVLGYLKHRSGVSDPCSAFETAIYVPRQQTFCAFTPAFAFRSNLPLQSIEPFVFRKPHGWWGSVSKNTEIDLFLPKKIMPPISCQHSSLELGLITKCDSVAFMIIIENRICGMIRSYNILNRLFFLWLLILMLMFHTRFGSSQSLIWPVFCHRTSPIWL